MGVEKFRCSPYAVMVAAWASWVPAVSVVCMFPYVPGSLQTQIYHGTALWVLYKNKPSALLR